MLDAEVGITPFPYPGSYIPNLELNTSLPRHSTVQDSIEAPRHNLLSPTTGDPHDLNPVFRSAFLFCTCFCFSRSTLWSCNDSTYSAGRSVRLVVNRALGG